MAIEPGPFSATLLSLRRSYANLSNAFVERTHEPSPDGAEWDVEEEPDETSMVEKRGETLGSGSYKIGVGSQEVLIRKTNN
ncbi:MAG: hypothetical protein M1829_000104 [Trizodia sp. TS-e1964]|nr:MAG: hypothetical protein M1829_000104 [Trizodia sp. TS-e1964]